LGFWTAIILSTGPKLNMQTSRMIIFLTTVIVSYLFFDSIKIVLAKQLKTKMTPTNIFKIKKIISVVMMLFGLVLMSQGWFPEEKEKIKDVLQNMEKIK
jgi:arginine exporter protein ArgO